MIAYCMKRAAYLPVLTNKQHNIMNVSETRTDYVMVKAFTSSEFESISFAIIHVNIPILHSLQDIMGKASHVSKIEGFLDVTFHTDIRFNFYNVDDISHECFENIPLDDSWCFINITEEELEQLYRPETRISYHQIVIDKGLDIKFKAYDKHSDDTYYTAEHDITRWATTG